MECKLSYQNQCYTGFQELIDTLWNVNEIYDEDGEIVESELIDTLWNVNVRPSASVFQYNGINRYIMECK